MKQENLFKLPFANIYPYYVKKAEAKDRTKAELDEVIRWLTGYNQKEFESHLQNQTSLQEFYTKAHLNPSRSLITGIVCGVRVEDIEDPTMQAIRYMDKLIDELAKGNPMEKILRKPLS